MAVEKSCSLQFSGLTLFLALFLCLTGAGSRAAELDTEIYVDNNKVSLSQKVEEQNGNLMLPLAPIVEALGDSLSADPRTRTITILRSQDGSTSTYNIDSGDITVNQIPQGNLRFKVPILMSPGRLLVPPEFISTMSGASIRPSLERVDIVSGLLRSPTLQKPKRDWRDFGVDYISSEGGATQVALNPATSGGTNVQPNWVRDMTYTAGGHVGPLDIVGKGRVLGGTDGRYFTFSTASINVEHLERKWFLKTGDNPLSNFTSRQLNGYPVRGALFYYPGKKFSFTKFSGVGFSQGIPVGGGAIRLSYERLLSVQEIAYQPNQRFKSALIASFFQDPNPFVLDTKQHNYYVDWVNRYNDSKTEFMYEMIVGQSKKSETLSGATYAFDFVGRRKILQNLTVYGEFDRVSPNFAPVQIGNAFTDRQDTVVGLAGNLKRMSYDVSGTFNSTGLATKKPATQKIINASMTIPTFRNGPNFSLVGNQTFFDPGSGQDLGTEKGEPAKSTIGTVLIDQKVFGFQILLSDTVTTNVRRQSKITSNSANIAVSKFFPSIGNFILNSQIGTIVSDRVQKTFDIRAVVATRPIFRGLSLVFGPGFSQADEFKRFTFNAGLNTSLPYLGTYNMAVNRSLALTTSQGRIRKTHYFNRSRARSEFDLDRTGKVAPFGSVSGLVFSSAVFPPDNRRTAPKREGIIISLDNQQSIVRTSDIQGKWSFDNIPAGKHKVSILLSRTPADLAIISPIDQYVEVRPGMNTQIDFAVAEMANLSGELTADESSGFEKEALGNVRVSLTPRDLDTLSGYDGSFTLTDVPPGKYTLTVDKAFLPSGAEAVPESAIVELKPGERKTGVKFILRMKAREVKIKKF